MDIPQFFPKISATPYPLFTHTNFIYGIKPPKTTLKRGRGGGIRDPHTGGRGCIGGYIREF